MFVYHCIDRIVIHGWPTYGSNSSGLQSYWEAGHFKTPLGELLLANRLDAQINGGRWGHRLTGPNFEKHLREPRVARDATSAAIRLMSRTLTALLAAAARR